MSDCESSTNDKDPIECSKHLLYEIEMFYDLGKRLVERRESDTPLHNALLEAFLVHARLLCDFFTQEPTHDDDISIHKHFGIDRCSLSTKDEELLRTDVNKRVAHLTDKRLTVNVCKAGWNIGRIVQITGPWVEEFSKKVCKKKVCTDFKVRVERCIESYRELEKSKPPISPAGQTTTGEPNPVVAEVKAIPTPDRMKRTSWGLCDSLIRAIRRIRG